MAKSQSVETIDSVRSSSRKGVTNHTHWRIVLKHGSFSHISSHVISNL